MSLFEAQVHFPVATAWQRIAKTLFFQSKKKCQMLNSARMSLCVFVDDNSSALVI